jgi:hypothetical protein
MQILLSGAVLALVGIAQAQVPGYGQCMDQFPSGLIFVLELTGDI